MKDRLVPYAHQWYRMHSVRFAAVNAAFLTTWAVLPGEFKQAIPQWMMTATALGLIGAGVAGALIKQPEVTNNVQPPKTSD